MRPRPQQPAHVEFSLAIESRFGYLSRKEPKRAFSTSGEMFGSERNDPESDRFSPLVVSHDRLDCKTKFQQTLKKRPRVKSVRAIDSRKLQVALNVLSLKCRT